VTPEKAPVTDAADFRALVAHSHTVQGGEMLEEVHKRLSMLQHDYMAVLDGEQVIGLCARRQIGMILGARFGFAMHSRKPVRDFLLPECTMISTADPLNTALQKVFTRPDEIVFDDVLLLNERGAFLGHIHARTFVRLQHSLFRQNIQQLENQRAELDQKNAELNNDLRLAGEVQLALLPQQYPQYLAGENPCVYFHHRYQPSGVVSGDFFQIIPLDAQTVGVFICDVMGHGVRSAFVTAMLRTLVQELGHLGGEPGELLTRVNRELKAILKPTGELIYATGFYLTADLATGRIRYAKASHGCPLLLQRGGPKPVESLPCPPKGNGAALGLFDGTRYPTIEADLQPGDLLLFFTDGLTEIFDIQGNEFGRDQLAIVAGQHRALPLKPLMDEVVAAAIAFDANHRFEDDLCFVGMEFLRHVSPSVPSLRQSGFDTTFLRA
jgi:serine phosphatase RsbU (regulator of sigma subunit)